MGVSDEKMPTRLACPVCRACKIKVIPSAMATAALAQVLNKVLTFSGFCTRATCAPVHNSARCAKKLADVRTADAATASTPEAIKGLIIKVATD